jgi:hypothetical protein
VRAQLGDLLVGDAAHSWRTIACFEHGRTSNT